MSGPGKIVIAGDWHANSRWAAHVIRCAAAALADEPVKYILQLGDFGFWPRRGSSYLADVEETCAEHGVIVMWIDGNHEDHDTLITLHDMHRSAMDFDDDQPMSLPKTGNLIHLPRGTRWTWHNRTWVALGGAVSVDREHRHEGRSWFPQEAITAEQAQKVIADGSADVMLTHDCPSGVELHLPPLPAEWRSQAKPAQAHRELLQQVVDAVQPSHLFHGHYHLAYSQYVAHRPHEDHGVCSMCKVTGLGMDGQQLNWVVCDTRTMQVEPAQLPNDSQG